MVEESQTAIVRKGGAIIQEESDGIGGGFVPVGSAVITSAGKLPCKAVIHTVGPRMGEGDEYNKLPKAVQSTLALAAREGVQKYLYSSYKFWHFWIS